MRDLLPRIESLPWFYALPVLALFLSLLAVIFWAYGLNRKERYDQIASLPLRDGGEPIAASARSTETARNTVSVVNTVSPQNTASAHTSLGTV